MVVIIIEGTDLAGKSTVIEKLAKQFKNLNTLIIKNCLKPADLTETENIYEHYRTIITMCLVHKQTYGDDSIILLDRFYPSQLVYSYLRGRDELEDYEVGEGDGEEIEDLLLKLFDVRLIRVAADPEVLEKRFIERGDEHVDINQIYELDKRYDQFMAFTNLRYYQFWNNKPEDLENIKNLVDFTW